MSEHTVEWETLRGRAENIRRLVGDFYEDVRAALDAKRFYGNEFDEAARVEEGALYALDSMEDAVGAFREGDG